MCVYTEQDEEEIFCDFEEDLIISTYIVADSGIQKREP